MRGAGGTTGGVGQFLIGLLMMIGGFYLLFNAITVSSGFGMGYRLYQFNAWGGGYSVTSGMIMIPFMIGVGIIFYNARNWMGWILASGSLTALVFGVLASIRFTFRSMSAFDLMLILVLALGGLGLFLRSLKDYEIREEARQRDR